MSRKQAGRFGHALEAFRSDAPVLIHDSAEREGETDLVYPAETVTPADVARLRNDAGGLVCVALSDEVARAVDLPFLEDALDHPATNDHELGYDDRSSFSLPVNHRDTYTGITDEDRARTAVELATMADAVDAGVDYGPEEFAAEFRSPGHVHLLRGAPDLLADRVGHTELGLALAAEAGRAPAVVVCEMLDDEAGTALPPEAARAYARRHDVPYVEGEALVEALG